MKKVLALILALVLALSLVACGGNNNKIVGKWVSKVEVKTALDKVLDQVDNSSITNILMNMIKSDIQNTYNDLTIDQVLEFNEKNGYKIYFEGAAELESTVRTNVEKVVDKFVDNDSIFRSSSLFKNMDSYSIKTLCIKSVMDALNLSKRFNNSIDGEYDIDNDKIYYINGKTFKEDYFVYKLEGNKLTISEIVGSLTQNEIAKDMLIRDYTKVN